MGSVYPRRRKQPDGSFLEDEFYTVAWKDHDGTRRTEKAYRDKRLSYRLLAKREDEVARRRLGLPVDDAAPAARPFAEAAAAYQADQQRRGLALTTYRRMARELCAIASWCDWRTLADIRADRFAEWLAQLPGKRKGTLASPRTVNTFRDQLARFCTWCCGRGWLAVNPITMESVGRSRTGAPGDTKLRPYAKRALTLGEFDALTTCRRVRAWRREFYRIMGLSGLRAGELWQVTPQDFTLGARPRWHPRPEIVKGLRLDTVPMLPECAAALGPLVAGLGPMERLFRSRPASLTIRKDFTLAGIPERDHRGRLASGHSLRFFYCTLLAKHLPIQTVRTLMRHRSIAITVNLYLDMGIEDVADQLGTLPPLLRKGTMPPGQTG